jgi:signal transduction histidine kinase
VNVAAGAVLLWTICVMLAVLLTFLLIVNDTRIAVINPLILLTFASAGALVAWRRPGNTIGWLFLVFAVLRLLYHSTLQYAVYVTLTDSGQLPGAAIAAWLAAVLSPPGLSVALFILVLFPSGRLLTPRWRPVGWLTATSVAVYTAILAVAPGPMHAELPGLGNPLGSSAWAPLAEPVRRIAPAFSLGLLLVAGLQVILRFRSAVGVERLQLKWFTYATGLMVLGTVIQIELVGGAVNTPVVIALPIAASMAILRYRLYDIDRLINRTLVYAVLTSVVIALYVLIVVGLSAEVQLGGNNPVALVATGCIAVLFQPLRNRVQRAVNHLLYGQRDEPYAVLTQLGQRLEAAVAPDAQLRTIVTSVRRALKLGYAGITLTDVGKTVLTVAEGEVPSESLCMPLIYHGDVVGELRVGPRAPGEGWSSADRRLLQDLARQAGAAANAVQLTAELQRSRERLVTAREEERRRLRRDLHDELAPTLAALALNAATARDRASADAANFALLDELYRGLRATVGDIRRLVYELRPPALDELGLVAALLERATQYTAADGQGLQVVIDAPATLPPLPAAVEVAAYRIVQEALMNVVRHAQARTCTVRLQLVHGLQVEICDDGVGLPSEYRAGVGLRSMRERSLELGGRCTVERLQGGGTHVEALLPVDVVDGWPTIPVPNP